MSDSDILLVSVIIFCGIIILGTSIPQPNVSQEKQNMTIPTMFGYAGYPRLADRSTYSTDIVDDYITITDNDGCNAYRMTIYYTVSTATVISMAQHFLDNCNHYLVLDLNHEYPQGTTSDARWLTYKTRCLTVLAALSAYDKLIIEICNERTDSDFASEIDTIVDAIRAAGYTNPLLADKWDQSWSGVASGVTDSSSNFSSGMHFYFNTNTYSYATGQITDGLNAGLNLINTECGADYNEYNYFDGSEVNTLNNFMDYCYNRDVSCFVWLNNGLDNYNKYQQLGLKFPPLTEVPAPEPPIEPPPIQYYYVNVSADNHGQTTPSGVFQMQVSINFTAVATANTDYKFDYWTRNGTTVSTNPTYTITDGYANTTYTLIAYFVANPPTEPDPPTPPAPTYFSVNIGISQGGTTSLTGNQTLLAGETLTVTVSTIKENYRFSYWLLDNSNWGTSQTFILAGTANTSYTLLPVFQYVTPPPQNTLILPAGENMGIVTKGNLEATFGHLKKVNKSIDFNDLLKQLGRT